MVKNKQVFEVIKIMRSV